MTTDTAPAHMHEARAASLTFAAAMRTMHTHYDRRDLILFQRRTRNLHPTAVRDVADQAADVALATGRPYLADLWLAYAEFVEAALLRPHLELVR
jgi:hypothetical protein